MEKLSASDLEKIEKEKKVKKGYYLVETLFGLDSRAISLFRVAISFILILDLYFRAGDMKAHYSDVGVLSCKEMWKDSDNIFASIFSIHVWFCYSVTMQYFLFFANFLILLSLLVGYKTGLSLSLARWFFISLHTRNPLLQNSGDAYVRLLLFWCYFVDLDAISLDKLHGRHTSSQEVYQVGTGPLSFITQIVLMYVMSYFHKTGETWKNGSAIHYVLSCDTFSSPRAKHFLPFQKTLKLLTRTILFLEGFGMLFIFIPFVPVFFRFVVTFAFVSFHIAEASFLNLGLFPYSCIVPFFALIPATLIDKLFSKLDSLWPDMESILEKLKEKTKFLYTQQNKEKKNGWFQFSKVTIDLTCVFLICYIVWCNVGTIKSSQGGERVNLFKSFGSSRYSLFFQFQDH